MAGVVQRRGCGTGVGRAVDALIPETLQHLVVPLDSIRPHPKNVRQGDIGAIVQSLKGHSQYRPLVVNKRDGAILAGNHTFAAAKALGWTQIAVTYVDVDEDEAVKIMLVDNRVSDLATNSAADLASLLQSLPTLEGTGYDGEDLDALLHDLDGAPPLLPEPEPKGVGGLQRSITFPDEAAAQAWDSLLQTLEERDPGYKPGARLARFLGAPEVCRALLRYQPGKERE